MRRRVKCCILVRIHFSTANQKIQIYFRYQSYTRRNLKKTVELWGREWHLRCLRGNLAITWRDKVTNARFRPGVFSSERATTKITDCTIFFEWL